MRLRLLAAVGALALLLSPAAPAGAAGSPGEACPTNGAYAQLGSGWIRCTDGTWQPSSAPDGSDSAGAAPAPTTGAATLRPWRAFTAIGTALTPSTFGSSKGQVADATAIRLPDGRVRVYVFVAEEGIRSATSTNSSGTTFVADATRPVPWTMAGQPRAVSLGGNAVRLFYLSAGSINAAVSHDGGVTFTDEGPVITTAQAGFEPGALSVIRQGGQYRGYFSNLERPGVSAERVMRTATSPDMLHWTMGPVITQAGGSIPGGGSHPFAVIDRKGVVALYFSGDRGSFYGVIVATSRDGVTFSRERAVLRGAGDPDVIASGRRSGLMYYGADLGGGQGFGIKVARSRTLVP